MADDEIDTGNPPADPPVDTAAAPDFSEFVPEKFKTDDGWDTAKFREEFDELATFRAQAREQQEALPEEATGFEWAMPEGHQWPEGFDPAMMKTQDENGNDVEFDPASMFDKDDPDVKAAQSIWHEVAKGDVDPQAGFQKLAGLMANREIRGVMENAKTYEAEIGKLGGEAKSRVSNLSRTITAQLPADRANALLGSLTTADAVRAVEDLIQKAGVTTPANPPGKNYSEMSRMDRLLEGLKERK